MLCRLLSFLFVNVRIIENKIVKNVIEIMSVDDINSIIFNNEICDVNRNIMKNGIIINDIMIITAGVASSPSIEKR